MLASNFFKKCNRIGYYKFLYKNSLGKIRETIMYKSFQGFIADTN